MDWQGAYQVAAVNWQPWFMLGLVVLVFIGLALNRAPDALMLGATVAAGLAGIIKPAEVFRGFSNENVLTVAALFVVAAALRETGALDVLGARMFGQARGERSAMVRLAGSVVPSSAFLNNTPIVAMFLPVVTEWCRKHRVSPSRLLMPLSYFAILGGICTLIGTSTNLVVNGLMGEWAKQHAGTPLARQLHPMSLFELGRVGLPMSLAGLAMLLTLGRRLLPDRKDLIEELGDTMREYLLDMQIQQGCRLIGQRVAEAGLRHLPGLFLVEITREGNVISPVEPDEMLRENDRLTFAGAVDTIVDLERIAGLVPVADGAYELGKERRDRRLCEAVISATSPIINKTVRDSDFRALYNAAIVAIHRGGERLRGRIGDVVLRPGDTLLLQAGPHFVRAHRNDPDFYLVGRIDEARPVRHERASLSILLLGLLIAGFALSVRFHHWMPPEVIIVFLVAGAMIATRCISVTDARQSVDWQTLVTIAASFGLGKAIENSGLARIIAEGLFSVSQSMGPIAALSAIYLMTMLMSELLSNNASAALMFPFAIATAELFGADARPFAMAIAFGASAAFATPIGYQTHMMVWSPGGYKFTDFMRVGVPMDILLWIVATALIPIAWPL